MNRRGKAESGTRKAEIGPALPDSKVRLTLLAALALLAGLGYASEVRAAAPTLEHLFPIALSQGATGIVAALGKFDPWPPKVWVDAPGITFRPTTNTGRFAVEVAPEAPAGPHLVRMFNEDGASGPRFLVVTREAQWEEQEPNDDFKKPQRIQAAPASINGRLEKAGDVDGYAIWLEAGQTLVASLEAFVLASPIDAVLKVVDPRGNPVALNHDDGRTFDPFLTYTAQAAGLHVIQVFGFAYPATSDVRFAGSPGCIYRLHLFGGPYVRHTLPLGVSRSSRSILRLVGWNLSPEFEKDYAFDGAGLTVDQGQTTWRPEKVANDAVLLVGEGPERMEQEPNDEPGQATAIDIPSSVTGRIGKPGDIDRIRFSAKKGDALLFEVRSAALGFPLDSWLRIEDNTGKELQRIDDGTGPDPTLEWTAPADGAFLAAVGNVLQRGGADCVYRLSVWRPVPSMRATIATNGFIVETGRTNEVKFSVKLLYGAKGRFAASVKGLPDGVQAAPVDVPEKGGDVVLKLVAAADAKGFSGPIRILLKEVETGREQRVRADLVATGTDNGVPNGFNRLLIESVEDLWLTVRPAKVAVAASAK